MEGYAFEVIGRMPFCTSDEIAALYGRPLDDVRMQVLAMKSAGLIEVGFGRGVGGSPERYCLTRDGSEELARLRGCSMEQLVKDGYAVTTDWLRTILQRSVNIPTFYALAVATSGVQGRPCLWYWRRRDWLDGTLEVGPGRLMRVGRIGASVRRGSWRSRLGNFVETWKDDFVNTGVFLTCDRTTEAFINRWLQVYGSGIYVWTVDERRVAGMDVMEKILTGPRLPRLIWRSFSFVLGNVGLGYGSEERSGLQIEQRSRNTLLPRKGLADRSFRAEVHAARLGVGERAVLGVALDWPLMTRAQVVRMTGYSERSVKNVLESLRADGYVSWVRSGGANRVVLAEAGLRYFSWVDRVQLRDMKTDWGLSSYKRRGSQSVGDIVGSKLGVLASQERHTDELYEVVSLLVEDCRRRQDLELLEVVPPHRSERWQRNESKTHGMRPDASAVVSLPSGIVRPIVIEYERRANVPEKMDERLEPYRRYYDSLITADIWSASVGTLVVYADRGTASRFVRYCAENPYLSVAMGRKPLPIFVSSLDDMRAVGAAGPCWMHANRLGSGAVTLAEACRVMSG